MKWFLALLSLLTPHADTRDLILVTGQSNAVGFDAFASELPADAADKEVTFLWRVGEPPPDEHDVTSGGQWLPLQPQPKGAPLLISTPEVKNAMPRQCGNFAKSEGGFEPEVGFARALRARNKDLGFFHSPPAARYTRGRRSLRWVRIS